MKMEKVRKRKKRHIELNKYISRLGKGKREKEKKKERI